MEGRNITRLNFSAPKAVAKRNQLMALVNNTRGQISIFFSASLIVLITIIAFVINIGLFVKAKINLQNATDAAAFSGAAVQSRQLSTIAYLNWEMRNIYKEWMYKYYVIGNLNIQSVENPPSGGAMNFRLSPAINVLEPAGSPFRETRDEYNIPAICIHTEGSRTNICRRYAVPGLPEFGSSKLPGAEEASRAFMDALIQGKVLDCGERTALNSLVSATWAYNVLSNDGLDETLTGRGPAVLANRQGAWPKAVELAMRIRNLEYVMNRQAETSGVCISGSTNRTNCSKSISDLSSTSTLGNERIVKAFYSGFRNLGNNADSEMKQSFTLTEIPPKEADLGGQTSASYLLVPGQNLYKKQYVDLKLMMVNLATFYGAMIATADAGSAGTTGTSGECVISKIATPVPGYPLGFYKNPDLLTYYAVRGEAEFVGMFNPFGSEPIKLTTYSAAKPFGGRIGPMLFTQKPNRDYIQGRTDGGKLRSVPYLSSLEFTGTPIRDLLNRQIKNLALGEFYPGVPIPINTGSGSDGYFWLESPDKPVGGWVTDNTIQFGIPNMVYDYKVPFKDDDYTLKSEAIHKIDTSKGTEGDRPVGLFSADQFKMFKGDRIGTVPTTQEVLEEEIARVRAPTLYEAANYLIPTPNDFNISKKMDSFGFIQSPASRTLTNGVQLYTSWVHAPLFSDSQTDVLWRNHTEVVSTIFDFLRIQKPGIDKYRRSMNIVAKELAAVGTFLESSGAGASGSADAYRQAARQIADISDLNGSPDQVAQSCKSLVGSFLHFYYGDADLYPGTSDYVVQKDGCPITLGTQLKTYFSATNNERNGGYNPTFYKFDFSWKVDNFPRAPHTPEKTFAVFSAYQPGNFTGVEADGKFTNPITGDTDLEVMRRNFYSTKFVSLDSLQDGGGYSQQTTEFAIYSEGATTDINGSNSDAYQRNFQNSLNADAVGVDVSSIKY